MKTIQITENNQLHSKKTFAKEEIIFQVKFGKSKNGEFSIRKVYAFSLEHCVIRAIHSASINNLNANIIEIMDENGKILANNIKIMMDIVD